MIGNQNLLEFNVDLIYGNEYNKQALSNEPPMKFLIKFPSKKRSHQMLDYPAFGTYQHKQNT